MILTIIIFLLTISFLVFIHEGGHFLVAKWTRVWVHQFAIGIGPAIWRWRRRETEYSLRLFPIGGYVRMAGDEEPAAGKKATEGEEPAESAVEVPPDRLFMAKSPWQRMAIIFAGPLMNVLGAVLIIILLVALVGVPFVQIAGFSDHSPAASVMQPGDVILAINGQEIYSTQQVSRLIANSQGRPLDLLITRGEQGKNTHVTVQPYWDNSQGRYLIGVSFNGILLNQIGNLPSGSPLYQQGLRVNDVIVSVNKQPVRDWYEFTNDLRAALAGGARPATLEIIQSGGQRVQQALDLSGTPADLSAWLQGVQPLVLPIYGSTNVVQEIDHRSFLAQEGIEKGDRLVAINGEPVYDFINLIYLTRKAWQGDRQVTLQLERSGGERTIRFELPSQTRPALDLLQGVELELALHKPSNPLASLTIGLQQTWDVLVSFYLGLRSIVLGEIPAGQALSGPVGIAGILGQSIHQGLVPFFMLVALLSLNLGIINLLPFPALDGSRIVFIIYELIRGKPFPPEKEGWVHKIGFFVLMGALLLIT